VGDQQQQRQRGRLARQVAQQVERGGVGPVQVVQQQHQRPLGRGGGEEGTGLGEERRLACRLAPPRRRQRRRQRRQVRGGGQRRERRPPGAIRRRVGQVVAAADRQARTALQRLAPQRLGQGGLADPRLPADQHQAAAPGHGEL